MANEIRCMTIKAGEAGVTLGDLFQYTSTPVQMTIVGVSCAPSADDTGLTIDINDDGTGVIEGIACATKATPGEWNSTHITGGTNTPVTVAAGSILSFDANSAAADTAVLIQIFYLAGVITG